MTERKTYTAEFKTRVVVELISGQKGLMQASREYEIKDTTLSRWKAEFLERAPSLFGTEPANTENEDKKQIAQLEQMVGRLTMELEAAKKVLGTSNSAKRRSERR
jgi:transposase-like protein